MQNCVRKVPKTAFWARFLINEAQQFLFIKTNFFKEIKFEKGRPLFPETISFINTFS